MNALQLQNLATLAAAAAAAQTSATSTNANPLSTTSSALGALTSPGKWKTLLFLHMMHCSCKHSDTQRQGVKLDVPRRTFMGILKLDMCVFSKDKRRNVFNERMHILDFYKSFLLFTWYLGIITVTFSLTVLLLCPLLLKGKTLIFLVLNFTPTPSCIFGFKIHDIIKDIMSFIYDYILGYVIVFFPLKILLPYSRASIVFFFV